MAVVSLTDYRPSPRFDSKAWTNARIEGAIAAAGPWVEIETIPLLPVDADPTTPQARNLSTEKAEPTQTWIRVVFVDADGDEQETSPISLRPESDPGDLTNLAAVRTFLQKQGADQGQDEVIQMLITAASKAITVYTQRQFSRETKATKTFDWDPSYGPALAVLNLAPYELASIESVTLDDESDSPSELTADEYRLWPRSVVDGTYPGIQLNPLSPASPNPRWGGGRSVTITGDWGLDAVPADVAYWTIVTVSIWLKRDVSAFATGLKVDEGYVERPAMLPSAAMAGLDQWKRVSP